MPCPSPAHPSPAHLGILCLLPPTHPPTVGPQNQDLGALTGLQVLDWGSEEPWLAHLNTEALQQGVKPKILEFMQSR